MTGKVSLTATDSIFHGGLLHAGHEIEVPQAQVADMTKSGSFVLSSEYVGKKKKPAHANKAIKPKENKALKDESDETPARDTLTKAQLSDILDAEDEETLVEAGIDLGKSPSKDDLLAAVELLDEHKAKAELA